MIEFWTYDSLESAHERLTEILRSILYDSDAYKDLNDTLKKSLDDLIKIFDSKKNKISFIKGDSEEELQYLIKAFMIYASLKKYSIAYVSENDNNDMIRYVKNNIMNSYPCKIKLYSSDSFFVEARCLNKISDTTILIFDNIDFYKINNYVDTSIFKISPFILVCNDKTYKM